MAIEAARLVARIGGDDSEARGVISGFSSFLGGAASVMTGILGADIFKGLVSSAANATREAMAAYASYESLGMSLQTLVAREIQHASVTERTVRVGTTTTQLTEKESAAYDKLSDSYARHNAQLPVMLEQLDQRIKKGKMSDAQIALERLNIDQLRQTIADEGKEFDAYSGKMGNVVPIFRKISEGGIAMADALSQASPKAQELLKWVQRLAIESPMTQEGIASAFRTVMAYGFTTTEAQRLTKTVVDFTSAIGGSEKEIGGMAYALGQIRASDKLLTQDLRQLINVGVDVQGILRGMGYSLADVGTTSIDSQKFLAAFLTTMEGDFGGAAKRAATSFNGLLSSLSDIKEVGLRELFAGTFQAIQPVLGQLVDLFSNDRFMAGLRGIGTQLGAGLRDALGPFGRVLDYLQRYYALRESMSQIEAGGAVRSELAQGGFIADLTQQAQSLPETIRGALTAGFGAGAGGLFDTISGMFQNAAKGDWGAALAPIGTAIKTGWDTMVAPTLSDLGGKLMELIFGNVGGAKPGEGKMGTAAADQVGGFLVGISTSLREWVSRPEVQATLADIGQNIGRSLINGIKTLFEIGVEIAQFIASLVIRLGQEARNNYPALVEIGKTLGQAMIEGAGQALSSWISSASKAKPGAYPGTRVPGGAAGLDMLVPPGYPNDSFPIRASSGERVTVINNQSQVRRGDTIIINDQRFGQMWLDQRRRASSNAMMG